MAMTTRPTPHSSADLAPEDTEDQRLERYLPRLIEKVFPGGPEDFQLIPLLGDASDRRYYRLRLATTVHGPMSMVNEQALVVGLLADGPCEHEAAVLRDMQGRGAKILALAAGCDWPDAVQIGSDIPEWGRPVLYLPVLQLLAYYRALANGQNPDQPANLTAVVSLDNL